MNILIFILTSEKVDIAVYVFTCILNVEVDKVFVKAIRVFAGN